MPHFEEVGYRAGSKTSQEAAMKLVEGGGARTLREWVLHTIKECGGATIRQVADCLNRQTATISARFRELELDGLIQKTEHTRFHPETNTRSHIYIAATDKQFSLPKLCRRKEPAPKQKLNQLVTELKKEITLCKLGSPNSTLMARRLETLLDNLSLS